jgi:pyruvate dehydrogenase E1 component alpha subunit
VAAARPHPPYPGVLKDRGLIDDEEIGDLEEAVASEIDDAWKEAQRRMERLGDPLDLFAHNYAELPAYLREQREEMSRRLKEG